MDAAQREQTLHTIANGIRQHRLETSARIVLEIIAPVGVIASQATLFVRPFIPVGRWADYLTAFEDAASWKQLHAALDSGDC